MRPLFGVDTTCFSSRYKRTHSSNLGCPLVSDCVARDSSQGILRGETQPVRSHRPLCPPAYFSPSSIPYACVSPSSAIGPSRVSSNQVIVSRPSSHIWHHNSSLLWNLSRARGLSFGDEHCTGFPLGRLSIDFRHGLRYLPGETVELPVHDVSFLA